MSVAVAAVIWLAAGYRLLILLRHPNFLNTMYCLIFVVVAAAFHRQNPRAAISTPSPVPTSGTSTKHLLVVVMGVSIELYILAVDVGRPGRRSVAPTRLGVATAVAIAMIATFAAAPIHTGAGGEDLDQTYLDLPQVMAYRLIFNAYLTFVLIENVRLYRRFGRTPGDEGRLTNLRLVAWGSAIGIVYSGTRVISILSVATTGHPLPAPLEAVGSVAALLAGVSVRARGFLPSPRSLVHRLANCPPRCPPAGRALVRPHRCLPRRGAHLRQVTGLPATGVRVRPPTGGNQRMPAPGAAAGAIQGRGPGFPRPLSALATGTAPSHGPDLRRPPRPRLHLLPPVTSRAEEVTRLLELADAYTAAACTLPAPETARR